MKEVNIYNVTITEVPEDIELEPCIRYVTIVADDIREVINTLTDVTNPFCKEEDITSITLDKKVYCYKYL